MELFTNLFAERQLQLNSIYDDNTSCIQCLRSDSQNRESLSRMLLTYVFPSNSYFAFLLYEKKKHGTRLFPLICPYIIAVQYRRTIRLEDFKEFNMCLCLLVSRVIRDVQDGL